MTFCFPGYPYQQPPQYVPRDYIRNPPPHSESGPPYPDPYPGYGPPERTYPAPHSGQQFSYPHPSHYDRGRHMSYSGPPPPPQPYPSQREGLVRMSPAPLDVPPPSTGHSNSVYHPEPSSRDRYAADGYYPPGAQPMNMRPYVRVSMALDMLCSHFSWCGYWGGGENCQQFSSHYLCVHLIGAIMWWSSSQPGLSASTPAGAVIPAGGKEGHFASTFCCFTHSYTSLPQRLSS